ncbi:ATP-binding cassette, subfamily B, MsbA [Algoriphagus ornithinivorans]|jgi:ABC-type multidrug transport system fused ATPase/permease subunit|uniref:ATP-binding cassette, subfamily B, MsbA n=1 Tax=Algoriphagus ornithinivorans TaxID=226506 RepID=A0A1I5HKL7_9BACT|nr:ABC transporter ATP-binding protein [Algoriphagus ornithinivorans]SFO48888.1 ATP-binding cassette, subfamily B, MsbA [Algoriphagus ornithinivorans]
MLNKLIQKYFRHFSFFYSFLGYRIFFLLFLSLLVGLLDGFGLALFIPIFQIAADSSDLTSTNPETMGELQFLLNWIQNLGFELNLNVVITFMVFLFLLKAIMRFIDGYFKIKLQNQFVKKLRYQLVNGLSDLDYKEFLNFDSGKIQNTLSSEGIKLTYGFLAYFNSLQHAILLLVYIGLAMLSNFQFAILVSIGGYLSNLVFKFLFTNTEKASIGLSKLGNSFQSFLVQAVSNFKYLKATDYFSSYRLKLMEVIDKIENNQKKIGIYSAIMSSTREPIILAVVVLIILIQVNVLGGKMSSILLSLMFLYRALNYIVTLQGSWQGFISNIGGLLASVELIDEFKKGKEKIDRTHPVEKVTTLELADLSFAYPSGFKVLDKINISLDPLKTYAFVGESGSGKTTLVNLVIGLLSPSEGHIIVNGMERNKVDISTYRRKFGYITQESVIFNDTLFNNITLWSEKTPENIQLFQNAIKLANLQEFLEDLPEKEETFLGDNGILISGGQKQRVSIARELYKNVDVLIFDEATSALDSETERAIQANIDNLMGKFTIIIIAHRLSTIKKADCIYLMEKGKIKDSGTFQTLLGKSLKFKKMVELQEF